MMSDKLDSRITELLSDHECTIASLTSCVKEELIEALKAKDDDWWELIKAKDFLFGFVECADYFMDRDTERHDEIAIIMEDIQDKFNEVKSVTEGFYDKH